MKNILVIYGGPRRNQNTEKLLNKFLEGICKDKADIEVVMLKDMQVSPCVSCYGCSKTGECIINDDMMPLYRKIRECDVIVIASPIYFANVSALTKTVIDRGQAFWSAKYLANIRDDNIKREGYFISTAGSADNEMFNCAKYTVKLFFAACNANYTGEVFAIDTDRIPVDSNEEVLKKAFDIGRNIAQ